MKKNKISILLINMCLIVLLAMLLSSVSFGEETKPIQLKLAHWVPPQGHIHTGIAVPWAREVEKRTGGRVKVTIYPAQALGKVVDAYDMAAGGIAEVTMGSPVMQPHRFPRTMVMDLPLLFSTAKVGSSALNALLRKGYVEKDYPDVKPMFLWTGSPTQVHTTKKAIRKVSDFEGMKIRSAGGTAIAVAKLLGATPVMIGTPEIYEALERGTVDGVAISWEAISQFGWTELLPYHTETNLSAIPFFMLMNPGTWRKLPSDIQKIIDGVNEWMAPIAGANWDKASAKSKAKAEELNQEIITFSPAETKKLVQIVSPRVESWIKEKQTQGINGAELLEMAKKFVKEAQ